jgi:hypothetical protein
MIGEKVLLLKKIHMAPGNLGGNLRSGVLN